MGSSKSRPDLPLASAAWHRFSGNLSSKPASRASEMPSSTQSALSNGYRSDVVQHFVVFIGKKSGLDSSTSSEALR